MLLNFILSLSLLQHLEAAAPPAFLLLASFCSMPFLHTCIVSFTFTETISIAQALNGNKASMVCPAIRSGTPLSYTPQKTTPITHSRVMNIRWAAKLHRIIKITRLCYVCCATSMSRKTQGQGHRHPAEVSQIPQDSQGLAHRSTETKENS